jgi:hypothetical protein
MVSWCSPSENFGPVEAAILTQLAMSCSQKDTSRSKVSVGVLMYRTKYRERSVRKALTNLTAEGLISRQLRNGSTGISKETILHWDAIAARRMKREPLAAPPASESTSAQLGVTTTDWVQSEEDELSRCLDILREVIPDHDAFKLIRTETEVMEAIREIGRDCRSAMWTYYRSKKDRLYVNN